MTQRLYYDDAYLSRFSAHIVERGRDPVEVFLDRTAFYPTSGGQPYDTGTIAGVPVIDVVEHDGRILHRLARPVDAEQVSCEIDWPRRFDHMQQHSGQHLLSAVFTELFNAATLSFHLGAETSTIDLDAPNLTPEQVRRAELRANEIVWRNRPIAVAYEEAGQAEGLRKESARTGTLRIVSIEACDRSACGGTHVKATGEIGLILLRKLEKVHGKLRAEFLCGSRAVRRARADYDALSRCARVFSASLDATPALVAALDEKLTASEKASKRLAREVAVGRGRELYRATEPDGAGLRRVVRGIERGPMPDELRTEARSFTSEGPAVFLALCAEPPSVLLATAPATGLHAGNLLKAALAAVGGRGGGNAQLAQGSVPSADALRQLERTLKEAFERSGPGRGK